MKQKSHKLIAWKFALSAAIIIAAIVFIATLLSIPSVLGAFSMFTALITDIYGPFGYSVTFLGAIIGAIFTFIDAFIITFIFAWLYNKLLE